MIVCSRLRVAVQMDVSGLTDFSVALRCTIKMDTGEIIYKGRSAAGELM